MSFDQGSGTSPQLIIFLVIVAVFIGILLGWYLFGSLTGGGPVPSGVVSTLLA